MMNNHIIDPVIMQDLLDSPGVKENVAQMTPEMLAYFKELLVSQGIYARFVIERKSKKRSGKGKRH